MRVLMVDDHPLFLEGLGAVLVARGIDVVGVAHDGLEAVAKTRRLRPDVILMDIAMPNCDGLEATRRIKEESPDVKVVILSASFEDDDLFEAIKSGASGYLLKNLQGEEIFELLAELAEGDAPLARGLFSKVLAEFARLVRASESAPRQPEERGEDLTDRQADILALVAQGLTYKEVAARLYLGERTVKYHMQQILERLRLESRAEAIVYAERVGLTARGHPTADTSSGR